MGQIADHTLAQVIDNLDSFGDDEVVYAIAKPKWNFSSPALVYALPKGGKIFPQIEDMAYMLEIRIAKDVLSVWQEWHDGRKPSLSEKIEAIIYYAENDAYLPPKAG